MTSNVLVNMNTSGCNIKAYIKKALEDDSFKHFEITLTGSTDQSDGYASDINFATVLVTTEEGINKRFEVAVKSNDKKSEKERGSLYKREAYFYETILPEITRFQIENNIKHTFNSVPKFYKYISDENMFVMVMENLKKDRYVLYDRKKPVDLNHVRFVLREYGKLHAVSFAFRSKRKGDFEKLVTNYDDVLLSSGIGFFGKLFQSRMKTVCEMLKEVNETKLYQMCHKICETGADVAMVELLKSAETQSAILHGDCWINNFLFKYETEDHSAPSKVAFLDWQLSRLHSPVLDLSCFIFCSCSEDQFKHFDELLVAYYTSFSTTLTDFGCDSETLFPYSALQAHWKKYSLYGFLISATFLNLIICEKEDAPSAYEDGNDFAEKVLKIQIGDTSAYERRLLAIVNHYYKYTSCK